MMGDAAGAIRRAGWNGSTSTARKTSRQAVRRKAADGRSRVSVAASATISTDTCMA
jgi:hypothetical protein